MASAQQYALPWRRGMQSSEFEWHTDREETFAENFGMELYDVREARRIVAGHPREVAEWPLEGKRRAYLEELVDNTRIRPDCDWAKVDAAFPIIFGVKDGVGTLIDGNHRVRKALDNGAATVRVVKLSPDETTSVRVR